jgi:hypothetical protein
MVELDQQLIEAESKLWKRVDDIAQEQQKHPDQVFTELTIEFCGYVEKKYTTKKTKGKISKTE